MPAGSQCGTAKESPGKQRRPLRSGRQTLAPSALRSAPSRGDGVRFGRIARWLFIFSKIIAAQRKTRRIVLRQSLICHHFFFHPSTARLLLSNRRHFLSLVGGHNLFRESRVSSSELCRDSLTAKPQWWGQIFAGPTNDGHLRRG